MMNMMDALTRLQWNHLFSNETLEASSLVTYESGTMLCSNNQHIESLFVVLEGRVKIYTLSEEGKLRLLRLKAAPTLIGDIEYASGRNVLHTVEAVGSVTCLRIPFEALRRHNRTVEFTEHLLRGVSEKLFIEANASSNHLMSTLEERLAGYLISLSESGNELFQAEMSQLKRKEVAEWLGTSYRHLNRTLQAFVDEGLVTRTRKEVVILNSERLKERANGMFYE
ncbi:MULTISPECIES: helix-turn-helix domain-containing protein [unclassified Exiguobacterium]|uniref:Crp/Fnr family transcriptional regulator n=1 Tax=unclassified Exiguobacterium TaxID=2644629 RepID=UPI001BE8854E|nr:MULTISPECIES: helix-turn-helix domain-containing protein [unclassified Exiguobacterium]